ncbi:MAG: polyprenyl synthetase family protein [Cyanobacteria bacterium P01_F01_bin.150]
MTQPTSEFRRNLEEASPQGLPDSKSKEAFYDRGIINEALQNSRSAIATKIKELIDTKRNFTGAYTPLYDLLSDYPFRSGKMLRPTICMSIARAVGGMGQSVLTTAAALELYHNAFLIHDDIEDGSSARRGKETLHQMIGVSRAINAGDATNVLAMDLLLENLSIIGVAKTLNVLHEIEFMVRQSVEGQAMELDWIASNVAHLTDQDYFRMCTKKTCWYTFISPCRIGLIVGNPSYSRDDLIEPLANLTRFGMAIGIAFQIQDDLLNLQGEIEVYGKEIGGDIYEGKRTLMLNHVIKNSSESSRIIEILKLPRKDKKSDQIAFILQQMDICGSIDHGRKVAQEMADRAVEIFNFLDFLQADSPLQPMEQWSSAVHGRCFIKELINYVIYRNK